MIFPSTVGNAPSSSVAIELGLKGPNVTQCQHEASGLLAIAMAAGYVAEGRADLMLAGGADEIPESFFRAFDALGVLARDDGATERSRPFAEGSRGFVMGEGAYLLRLVPASEAPALAVVAGHAVASDLVPPETWPRDPGTVAQAVEAALEDAGASACDVDLVVASANGVPALEDVEARGLLRAFHGKLPPVTGVKRLTGEMGGSGAASAVAAVLALQHQRLFGALGGDAPRASLPFSPWAKAMEAGVHLVVVTALAAGGTVAALVLTRA
jgi:3-oxoacyl-(acyl-carrier-protein) synthase